MSNIESNPPEPRPPPIPPKKDIQDSQQDHTEQSPQSTQEETLPGGEDLAPPKTTPGDGTGPDDSAAETTQAQESAAQGAADSNQLNEEEDPAGDKKETNGDLSPKSDSKDTSDSMRGRHDPDELHSLRDEVSKLRQHRTTLEERLKDEKHRREWADHVLGEREEELSSQEAALQAKETELAKTKQDLSRARDHIFQLQPRRTEITETEAAAAFNDLYLGVKRWVQNRLDPILADLDDGRLNDRGPVPYRGKLLSLVRSEARGCFEVDQSDEYHIIACVWEFLAYHLFERAFYCPLDGSAAGNETINFLNSTCDAMKKLPRDFVQVRNWRSEALVAITSQSDFKARELQHIDSLSYELSLALSVVMPEVASGAKPRAFEDSVRSSIMEPAVDLVRRLQLATRVYSVAWWSARKPGNDVKSPVDLAGCELLNITTGGQPLAARKGAPVLTKKTRALFSVAPGLLVQDVNAPVGPPRALRKPVVLVHDGGGELVMRQTIMSWVESREPQQQQQSQGHSGVTGKRTQPSGPVPQVVRKNTQPQAEPPSTRRSERGVLGRFLGR